MEPQDPVKRAEYLERMLAGLEQTRESLKFELPYYKPDDLQGKYAHKFLEAVEKNIEETKAKLDELRRALPPSKGPKGQ